MTDNIAPSDALRVRAEDKRIINAPEHHSDLNQLIPFRYDWAWQKYLSAMANHWTPTQVPMSRDIALWKSADGLTADERLIVKRALGFFSTADTNVDNNLMEVVVPYITAPEVRQYMARQIDEEALHSWAYQYCIESLGMDQGEIFNMYREVPSIGAKLAFMTRFQNDIKKDKSFDMRIPEHAQRYLRNLINYYLIMEGLFFYVGFPQLLTMGRMNKLTGIAEQIQYILRDESMHVNFGIDVINTIIIENPELWTPEFKELIIADIREGVDLEIAYARDTMPRGVLGMNANLFEGYLKFIANRRLVQVGLPQQWPNAVNPFPWMAEMIDIKKEKNFFETHVTDYQAGGALKWD